MLHTQSQRKFPNTPTTNFVYCGYCSDELSTFISQKWGLKDAGFNYNLAAIFGSQSTGKSKVYAKATKKLLFFIIAHDTASPHIVFFSTQKTLC